MATSLCDDSDMTLYILSYTSVCWMTNEYSDSRTDANLKEVARKQSFETNPKSSAERGVGKYIHVCVCVYVHMSMYTIFAFAIVYLQSKMVPRSNIVFSELYIYNTNA